MTHKLIKTDNYLLVVDNSEIKAGDWLYGYMNNNTFQANKLANLYINSKKIIAHLPLNNSPILEGVDLLPPLEDDVEAKGYNKAKEKYRYTEEDMRRAIDMAREEYWVKYTDNEYAFKHKEEEIIQSLQQPKYPVGFECKIELYDEGGFSPERKPKTTTNSQGQTQLVGTYIYE